MTREAERFHQSGGRHIHPRLLVISLFLAVLFLAHDAAMAADIHGAANDSEHVDSRSHAHGTVHDSVRAPITQAEADLGRIGFASDAHQERCETIRAAVASATWNPATIAIQTGEIGRLRVNRAVTDFSHSLGPDPPLSPGSRRALLQVYRL